MIKDRIKKLIEAEQFTPTKFADAVGVQRSNISHILSGRNKPSLDFIQKVLTTFSNLSSDWLLFGRGPMYNDESNKDLFAQPSPESTQQKNPDKKHQEESSQKEPAVEPPPKEEIPPQEPPKHSEQTADVFSKLPGSEETKSKKQIVRIIVIFQDGTFKEYTPG